MREYLRRVITDKKKGFTAGVLKIILAILSIFYGLSIRFILLLYKFRILKSYKPKCKVISIGNITWGGTGKTPLVEKVAGYIKSKDCKVAILSRGYRLNSGLADEPAYLKDNLNIPIFVGRDRVKNAKLACQEFNINTIILDDGFQHWRIARDLDIICIDATNPFGNGWVLPAGILREPLSSLRRSDIFFLTKTDSAKDNLIVLKQTLEKINPKAMIVESVYEALYLSKFLNKSSKIKTDELKGKKIALLAGVANHDYFEYMVSNLGVNVFLKFYYPDHYPYKKRDLDRVIDECAKFNIGTIITTQKDAVKLSGLEAAARRTEILTLHIAVKIIQNESEFYNRLSSVYNR